MAFLWLEGSRNASGSLFVLFFFLMATLRIVVHAFIYWEIDNAHLRERRLWSIKEIPWAEIARVGSWIPGEKASDYLEIDYARSAPLSDRGSIIANPKDRSGFLAGLHRFATSADFEV